LEAASFNRMMTAIHGTGPAAVAEAYDFTATGHVVDVGGGVGTLLRTVLQARPRLRGTVFDLPAVVAQADLTGVEDWGDTKGGDFFVSVSAGADVYLLSHVLHDWDDEACVTILGRCRDAMAADSRLLVIEMVLPASDEDHPTFFTGLALTDLQPGASHRSWANPRRQPECVCEPSNATRANVPSAGNGRCTWQSVRQ
jgi:O-methyltransferase domain